MPKEEKLDAHELLEEVGHVDVELGPSVLHLHGAILAQFFFYTYRPEVIDRWIDRDRYVESVFSFFFDTFLFTFINSHLSQQLANLVSCISKRIKNKL